MGNVHICGQLFHSCDAIIDLVYLLLFLWCNHVVMETCHAPLVIKRAVTSAPTDHNMSLIEMKPQWFSFEDIPYKTMWPDDEYWYPYLLSGKRFNAYFKFQGMEYIIEQRITELPSLDDHKI